MKKWRSVASVITRRVLARYKYEFKKKKDAIFISKRRAMKRGERTAATPQRKRATFDDSDSMPGAATLALNKKKKSPGLARSKCSIFQHFSADFRFEPSKQTATLCSSGAHWPHQLDIERVEPTSVSYSNFFLVHLASSRRPPICLAADRKKPYNIFIAQANKISAFSK